ncbi:hypothetical protein Tco_0541226 [Tanacetum coccineum]
MDVDMFRYCDKGVTADGLVVELKPWSEDTRRTSGNTTRNDPFPPFLILEAQTQVACDEAVTIHFIYIAINFPITVQVENPIEHEDETFPFNVYEVGESSTAVIPREDGDRLLPGFMRWDIDTFFGRMVNFSRRMCGREMAYALVEKKSEAKDKFYGKLILDLGNEVHSSVDQGMAAMERLVEKLGNVKEKAECKNLKKELEEAKLSNTFLRMQNEPVKRDLNC